MNAVPLALDEGQGLTLKLYERGCALLERCITFDETKYWDSLADAAAAWAKIHDSDRVEKLAKSLKLRAYRRLGEIAAIEQPGEMRRDGQPRGRVPGPHKWLTSRGMTQGQSQAARMLAGMPQEKFESIAGSANPPLPTSYRRRQSFTPWQAFADAMSFANVRAQTKRVTPATAAALDGMKSRAQLARDARRIERWFGEFAKELETRE